ncbi:MAG: hypothetical protein IT371_03120 [Deltaproteobacteria bacterium]|nr:hypothetical protein [Deltaproteobacteria bacterium]
MKRHAASGGAREAAGGAVLLALVGIAGCSETIPLPKPTELVVAPVVGAAPGTVELSWKLVVRVDGYRLHFDDDRAGVPYEGRGLSWVAWPTGCGDFDGSIGPTTTIAADLRLPDGPRDAGPRDGTSRDGRSQDGGARDGRVDLGASDARSDGTPRDAGAKDSSAAQPGRLPGMPAASPLEVPEAWCLDRVPSYTDAGDVPSPTPAMRPRLRLQGLVPGRTYYFAVQAFRRATQSELSDEVQYVPAKGK